MSRDEAINIAKEWEVYFKFAQGNFPRKEMYLLATQFLAEVARAKQLEEANVSLADENRLMRASINRFLTQIHAFKNNWAGFFRKCDKCDDLYGYGGNWGGGNKSNPVITCPKCELKEWCE